MEPRSGYEEKEKPPAGFAAIAAARAAEAGESVAAVTRALAAMTSVQFSRHYSSPPPQVCLESASMMQSSYRLIDILLF